MEYEFAPLEGITDAVYRRNHRAFYPGITRYYTPFISPTQHHVFTPRQLRELKPSNNGPILLIPQLLGKNAEDILWAARALADMGYREVNLNLGCPSGTVTAKGKGAGLLRDPQTLDDFLGAVFRDAPVSFSIKTRIGWEFPEEFPRLLAVFSQYPVRRLIIHPRTREQLYTGSVHRGVFADAVSETRLPLCYNGDLFTPEDCMDIRQRFPTVQALMMGRGLAADPGLAGKLLGQPGNADTLYRFLDTLGREYRELFGGDSSAMHRMKAIWTYVLCSFRDGNRYRKRLIKARRWDDLRQVTEEIFQKLELLPAAEGVGKLQGTN